jgi:hypothetical protein
MKYIYILLIIEIIIIVLIIYDDYKIEKFNNNELLLSKERLINFINVNLNDNTKKLILFPHLELGDNLIFNGIVRHYCSIYNKVVLVCKKIYYNQLKFMYSDLDNIIYYDINRGLVEDWNINILSEFYYDDEIKELYKKYNIEFIPICLYKPQYNMVKPDVNTQYPEYFFDELNLPHNIRYDNFKVNRDISKEENIYNTLINIIGNKYNIIIDDEKRDFIINDDIIKNEYPTFKLGNNSINKNKNLDEIKTDNIFDYIKLLENAEEIHTIDSSIVHMIDLLNLNVKTYIYKKYRPMIVIYNNKNFIYIY